METGRYSQPLSPQVNAKKPTQPSPQSLAQMLQKNEEELNLRRLLTVVRRRALVIVGIAIAISSATAFWTLSRTSKYEGKFQLLVEPVTAENQLDKLTQVTGTNMPNAASSGLDYDTQIQVLRSPNLMAPILKQIQTRYPDVDYNYLFGGGDDLSINRLEETKILEVRFRDTDPKKIKYILHEVARGYLRYSLQERQLNVSQGIKFVDGQLPTLKQRVDKLQGQLQTFRQQYNLLDPETQSKELSERVSSIEQQRLDTVVKLNETRSLYTTLKGQLGTSPNEAIAISALSEAPRYQQLLNQYQELEVKAQTELARFTEDSPIVQSIRAKQDNLLPMLRAESQQLLGNNPAIVGERDISPNSIRLNLTQQLVEATNQMQVLQVRERGIAIAENQLKFQVKQMPFIARQYTDLQRELQVATDSFNRFLGVQETLQIEAAQKALPWQIILRPEQPQQPILPKKERDILLGSIAGLLLGIGVALLLERLDNVFHSPEELSTSTGLPLLGVIPHQKQLTKMLSAISGQNAASQESENPQPQVRAKSWYNSSPFLESFRSLHTNIRFLGSDTPIHSLVVSSATPGDGKSTISVHLAQAAAAMGQRVLLVDADLRRPQVHRMLGLENKTGLSNVIATGITAKEAIQRLPMWDRLYVLTAGQLPPDPTRLLSSRKMHYLMEQFHAVFDLVIYDTPPVLGLADGRLLAAHTDGVVIVAGLGRTDRAVLMQALDGLKVSNASVLGVVANGVKGYAHGSYYYYNHYYTAESDVERAKQLLQKGLKARG